jgi:hypothetical protein
MEVRMTVPTDTHESCWTDEYLIAHSEGYRVEDECGVHVGVVESVVWSEAPFGRAEAVVVRCAERPGHIEVACGEIADVDPWEERIVVRAGVAGRRPQAVPRPASAQLVA